MTTSDFRKELLKIMPGYNWTIRKTVDQGYMKAVGIQTRGLNRMSTLQIERMERSSNPDTIIYRAKSSGFGKKAPWLFEVEAGTLAQALRNLQNHYETKMHLYSAHANALDVGRRNRKGTNDDKG